MKVTNRQIILLLNKCIIYNENDFRDELIKTILIYNIYKKKRDLFKYENEKDDFSKQNFIKK